MTKEEIRDKALKFISERASGIVEEMNYYAEILTEFVVEKIIKELSKRILEQQKTIGSLTDTIDELKAQVEKNEVLW